jgi:hypothetical protein
MKKMKNLIGFGVLVLTAIVMCSMVMMTGVDRIITGKVVSDDGKPLIGANVIIKGTSIGTLTDLDGNFELEVGDGEVILVISYTGFNTAEMEVKNSGFLQISLSEGAILETVVVDEYSKKETPLTGRTTGVNIIKADKSSSPPILIRGAATPKSKLAEEAEYSSDLIVLDGVASGLSLETASHTESSSKVSSSHIKSGTLTAGEWNDLNNWEDWKSLLKNKDFTEMESYWSFQMEERYSVFVTNKYELPVVDCTVVLKDKSSTIIWQAKTDNSGKAELWNGVYGEKKSISDLRIEIEFDRKIETIQSISKFEDGVNHIQINTECNAHSNVDIMFVVDATGSMGDEIEYLKVELEDVVSRVKMVDRDLKFRLGSVFFRDKGDEYVTKQSPLSSDISKSIDFFKNNIAGGGGDYPEAVHSGLNEAMMQDWSQNAMARIIFLVLDAPPHHEAEVIQNLQEQIQEAARLGIKIIPITASGINRQTEFLMKFFSLSTNGTYVFLTDDSGIGGKHLDPVVSDFEVEKLNDLMVRLISNFTKTKGCTDHQQSDSWKSNVKLYPNPTSNFVNIYLEEDTDKLLLRSASGMIVYTKNNVPAGETRVDLESMVDGVYTVQLVKNGESMSKQLILIN